MHGLSFHDSNSIKVGSARREQLLTMPSVATESLTVLLRMTSRGALEWIRMFEDLAGFRYEISDLLQCSDVVANVSAYVQRLIGLIQHEFMLTSAVTNYPL